MLPLHLLRRQPDSSTQLFSLPPKVLQCKNCLSSLKHVRKGLLCFPLSREVESNTLRFARLITIVQVNFPKETERTGVIEIA